MYFLCSLTIPTYPSSYPLTLSTPYLPTPIYSPTPTPPYLPTPIYPPTYPSSYPLFLSIPYLPLFLPLPLHLPICLPPIYPLPTPIYPLPTPLPTLTPYTSLPAYPYLSLTYLSSYPYTSLPAYPYLSNTYPLRTPRTPIYPPTYPPMYPHLPHAYLYPLPTQWADPEFPCRWECQISRGGAPTYDFAKFSQKLHEIERIWTRGGGTRPLVPPLDPTTTTPTPHLPPSCLPTSPL